MYKVKSTYKVLTDKALQQDTIEEWVDWALEMMEAGFETEHLIILAGLPLYLNRSEFNNIVNSTLRELSLDTASKEEIVYGYVYYLIDEALNLKMSTKTVLNSLRELCRERNYDENLFPFYLLAFAQEDLETIGVQFYWQGADNENIDSIINDRFREWKNKYEAKTPDSA